MFNQVLIDSHCHLDFQVFDDDRAFILDACQKNNIRSIIIPGVCRKEWQKILDLCLEPSLKQGLEHSSEQTQKILYPALGLHPCFTHEHKKEDLEKLEHLCSTESLIAIGEIGLDFFITKRQAEPADSLERQLYYFSEQLKIAEKYRLPVLIHARRSHDEIIKHLKLYPSLTGIIHAYSGSYEQAIEYLKLGFKLGFGGAYTYPKATKLRTLVSRLPLSAWVLETDAPDMSPVKHHGKRNSPHYLIEIAQEFISLYDKDLESQQIFEQLYQNTLDVLPSIQKRTDS